MKIRLVIPGEYKWLATTPRELSSCPTGYILVHVQYEESGERRVYVLPGSLIDP
jgi:hypothetical protein